MGLGRQLVCRAESAKLFVRGSFAGQKVPNCSSAARLPGRKRQTVRRQLVCKKTSEWYPYK